MRVLKNQTTVFEDRKEQSEEILNLELLRHIETYCVFCRHLLCDEAVVVSLFTLWLVPPTNERKTMEYVMRKKTTFLAMFFKCVKKKKKVLNVDVLRKCLEVKISKKEMITVSYFDAYQNNLHKL